MRRYILSATLSSIVLVLSLWSGAAHALASRTWVSGVGNDSNPCSRTAPCQTFAAAIANTAPGGEIDALDPGSFGTLTIYQAITIDGGGGQVASVLAASSNNGIVVQAGAGDTVILRNLRINGINSNSKSDGIYFVSGGKLYIENCDIFGFSLHGIDIETAGSTLTYVTNTSTTHNGTGVYLFAPAGGSAHGSFVDVRADQNSFGFLVDGAGGGSAAMTITRSTATMNGTGVIATGAGAQLLIGSSDIALNGTGVSVINGASVTSNKDNHINLNGTDGTPLPVAGNGLN
jgi:hypothetical protein